MSLVPLFCVHHAVVADRHADHVVDGHVVIDHAVVEHVVDGEVADVVDVVDILTDRCQPVLVHCTFPEEGGAHCGRGGKR